MTWIRISAILGFLGVLLGAFGAHGLRGYISPILIQAYQTGVLYHLIHSVALLGYGVLARLKPVSSVPAICFLGGVILFSGSLYVLAITGIKAFGAITPIGGGLFLAGWAAMFITVK